MAREETPASVRLDKWLWAARFFKSRSAATTAVAGGKATVNGEGAKPAHIVHPGDTVGLRMGPVRWELEVTGIAERRGTTAQAAALYRETPASLAARTALAEQLRLAPKFEFSEGRPSKKERRTWQKLRSRD